MKRLFVIFILSSLSLTSNMIYGQGFFGKVKDIIGGSGTAKKIIGEVINSLDKLPNFTNSTIDTADTVIIRDEAMDDSSAVTKGAPKENNDSISYPILGFFRLGMTESEFERQQDKILEQTAIYYKGHEIPNYYISIGGIPFDVSCVLNKIGVDLSNYKSSKNRYSLLFYTGDMYGGGGGSSYFMEVKNGNDLANTNGTKSILVSMTFPQAQRSGKTYGSYEAWHVENSEIPRYYYVGNLDILRECSQRIDSLIEYLNGKFGDPVKTNKITVAQGDGSYRQVLSPQVVDRGVNTALIPCAEWKQGEMTIVLGVDEKGCITLSFVDNHYLSREYLESILDQEKVPEQAPRISW